MASYSVTQRKLGNLVNSFTAPLPNASTETVLKQWLLAAISQLEQTIVRKTVKLQREQATGQQRHMANAELCDYKKNGNIELI